MLRSGLQQGVVVSKRLQSGFAKQARDVLSASEPTLSELKNGVRVVSSTNNKPVSTIGVWVDSGSRYETEDNNGVAKVLEQLIYKGSAKRSTTQLQADLAKYGARLNSFTSRDHAAYFVQVENQNVEPVTEILADVLRSPKFDAADVEAAKLVVIKQLEEVESNHEEVAFDYLHMTAFQGTSLGLSPYGRAEAIQNLTRQDVIDFADDHYKADRVVVAAVGGVPHGQLEAFAKANFGDLDNQYKRAVPAPLGTRFTGSEFQYRDDSYPGLYVALAVEGVPNGHPDALPLQLSVQLTGQWDITHGTGLNAPVRAVQQISQLHGLKVFEPFSVNYADTGLFGLRYVSSGEDQEDSHYIVSQAQRAWKHHATGLTDEEVDRAKNQLRSVLLSRLGDNTSHAHHLATRILHTGDFESLAELEEKIRRLTAGAVREAVSRHVYDRDLAVGGVGRTEAIPNYVQIRATQSWWRL
ncbi:unnamed protein product [Bursaphelenchus xylophilus]|uniref:(pine wood nematode) hypothetical protein n=1 Tax=Bursaphelenchus xylophilus TaxID=6326 RepID=A0A1I7SCL8_BURXY|nr:unnamed protein product [Bursaphelenchus xylophilus]CAG9093877.1 unnamed protein product [Bursaphelenchus xylophilus]